MAAGIIKELTKDDCYFYNAQDVMKLLEVSQDKAYRIIREMRNDLIEQGKLFRGYPPGKIPKKYFDKMCGIE